MKYLLAFIISMMMTSTIIAKETINVYTKFSVSGAPFIILSEQIKLMNNNDSRFNYKISNIIGAQGESAILRSFIEGKTSKVLLYSASSDFTLLENNIKNGYDKIKDFIFIHSLQKTDQFLMVPKKSGVATVKQLIDKLKNKDTIFVGIFTTTKLSRTFSDKFLERLKITKNIKHLNYTNLSHISLSLSNNEFDFIFFDPSSISISEANILMAASDDRSNYYKVPTSIEMGYNDISYNNATFFATTKNNIEIAKHVENLLSKTCSDKEMLELLEKYKRTTFCRNSADLTSMLENDYNKFK